MGVCVLRMCKCACVSLCRPVDDQISALLGCYDRQSAWKLDWSMEKSWPLNPSRSKMVTTGIDISALAVRVSFGSDSSHISVHLTVEELKELLSEDWVVRMQRHLDSPKKLGDANLASRTCDFRCETLKKGEPGLKISRYHELGASFVYLGTISVQELIRLRSIILDRVSMLERAVEDMKLWLLNLLEQVSHLLVAEGLSQHEKEKNFVPSFVAPVIMKQGIMWDREGEFRMDMLHVYHKQFFAMLMHYVYVMDR